MEPYRRTDPQLAEHPENPENDHEPYSWVRDYEEHHDEYHEEYHEAHEEEEEEDEEVVMDEEEMLRMLDKVLHQNSEA